MALSRRAVLAGSGGGFAALAGGAFWILGVIAALEFATWLVSFIPFVPTLASFALVGPLHALAIAVVFETRTVSG